MPVYVTHQESILSDDGKGEQGIPKKIIKSEKKTECKMYPNQYPKN